MRTADLSAAPPEQLGECDVDPSTWTGANHVGPTTQLSPTEAPSSRHVISGYTQSSVSINRYSILSGV